MKEILREIDTSLDEYSLEQIIDEVDEDGSGTVDFDEFMAMMTGEWFFTNKSHFFNKKAQQPIGKLLPNSILTLVTLFLIFLSL